MSVLKSADAVVIGGGILGASVAHFLAKRPETGTVCLLERGGLCSGVTRYSAANVRQHYSSEVGIRLAVRAVEMFSSSDAELGGSTGFTRCGYMVIVPRGEEQALLTNVPLQQSLGVAAELLDVDQIAGLYPDLNLDRVALGCLEHTSGYADPVQTVLTLVRSAEEDHGLRAYENAPAVEIETRGGRVEAVVTAEGAIATPVVVNAAGPWADQVAALIGLDYGLTFSREHEAVFRLPPSVGAFPVVADVAGGIFFRPDGEQTVLVGETYPKELEPCDPDDWDERADEAVVLRMAAPLGHRLPALDGWTNAEVTESRLVRSYSGVYSITSDWHPIVGPAPGIEGYYSAVGGSGHCFKIGPPIGEALAALIVGDEPAIDIASLRHTRFEEGEAFGSSVWGPGNRA